MGLFEAWDRHNQRTLEWHNHIASEARRGRPLFKSTSAAWTLAIVLGVMLGRRVLERWIGVWVWLPLFTLMFLGFYSMAREMGARRKEWDARRGPKTKRLDQQEEQ